MSSSEGPEEPVAARRAFRLPGLGIEKLVRWRPRWHPPLWLSLLAFAIVVIPVGDLAEHLDWPSAGFWAWGSEILILLAAVVNGGSAVWIYRAEQRNAALESTKLLEQAALLLLIGVNDKTGLLMKTLSCSVWAVPGEDEEQHLKRVMHVPEPATGPSGITFERGVGVVGKCWLEGEPFVASLAHLQPMGKEPFEQLSGDRRYNLGWEAFCKTRRYAAIATWPLTEGGRLVGFVCVDSTDPALYGFSEAIDASWSIAQGIGRVRERFQQCAEGNRR